MVSQIVTFLTPYVWELIFLLLYSVQSLSRVWLFATPWIAARRASLSITNSRSSLKLMSIELVMPSSHLILCGPFSSCPQSLPASESFPMSQLFAWGGQSTGVSALASVLPKNTQGWSPSEWTGWISLQSKGLSRVFSNTTVQKHQFFGAQLSYISTSEICFPFSFPLFFITSVGKFTQAVLVSHMELLWQTPWLKESLCFI